MAFTRTVSGLSNQHLFHNVDYVVFVEGGQSFTKLQVDQGHFNEQSIDTIFWKKVFDKYKDDANIKFKAVGSKSVILKIAEDIVSNNLTSIYVAMDQEFDIILSKMYKHDRILYTFGYSWENDVWNEDVIESILSAITAQEIDSSLIINPFQKFLTKIKFSVYTDGYQFSKNSSFFPRPTNHLRIIDCNTNNIPTVKSIEITNLFSSSGLKKATVYAFGSRKKISSKRYCYGHLYGDFCKLLINHLLKTKHKLNSLSDEIIRRMAINYFGLHIAVEIDEHYSSQFN